MTDEAEPPRPPRPRSPAGVFDPLPPWVGPSTKLVHGARRPELNAGAVVAPIYQTSTFHFPEAFSDAAPQGKLYLYSRMENPTLEVAAELVRRLEGAESARVFGSGMGAVSATLLTFLRAGDEIVALSDLYGGTVGLLETVLPRLGVRVRWVTEAESHDPDAAIGPATKLVLLESPTNPLLRVYDLARWAKAADRVGALTVVDNTFATPINQRPIELGADLVVHSGTKYLGGHSDLLAGVVAGSDGLLRQIDPTAQSLGAVLDPMAAFLLARGLRTLALRVARQNENGRRVAEAIRSHPKVERVYYPGFRDASENELAGRQMSGRGGVVAVLVRGGRPSAYRLMRQLRLVHVAASLGGVESLVSLPSETSHLRLTAEERAARGIDEGLLRFSFGIEEPDDLVRDLTEALDAL